MTDARKLRDVFYAELEATGGRDVDAALAAVVTAVKAHQLELPIAKPQTVDLRVTVVHRRVTARRRDRRPPPTLQGVAARVIPLVAAELGIPASAIVRMPFRSQAYCSARWIAGAILRSMGLSLPRCGQALWCDHTTILYGCRQVARRPELQAAVARIRAQLALEETAGLSATTSTTEVKAA